MSYDVAAYRKSGTEYVNRLADEISSGDTVTGIQKLAQRYLLKLMTRRGSIPYMATEGSTFMPLIVDGGAVSEADVFAAFTAASVDVASSLAKEELATDDNSERFGAAYLQKLTVMNGSLRLDIKINNKLGESIGVRVPIQFSLRKGEF
jgi:hypothetical protein